MSEPRPRRVVVTGGASGIGAATVRTLSAQGHKVGVMDLNRPDGGTPFAVADVTDGVAVSSATGSLATDLGGIDCVVNCAGAGASGSVVDNDEEEWQRLFDVNVISISRTTRSALPYLRESDGPSIVNVSSVVALVGFPDRALYSATKGAVHALTRAMAADFLQDGIRVNCVVPGTASTPWIDRLLAAADDPEDMLRRLTERQPMGRLVTADEVADAIAYLVSPASSATTGSSLVVDGGVTGLRVPPPAQPGPAGR